MTWGVVDVRECGAAGDGCADDTEPVLKAVDQLPEAGGVLYFPPGIGGSNLLWYGPLLSLDSLATSQANIF